MKNTKSNEGRLRRRARELGMAIVKSRARNPNALDFGLYALVHDQFGSVVLGGGVIGLHSCTLGHIAAHLALLGSKPPRLRSR